MALSIADTLGANGGEAFDNVPVTKQGTDYLTDDHLTTPASPTSRESTYGKIHWKLETIEPAQNKWPNITIKGQFPLQNIKVKMDNKVPHTNSYGQQEPLVQWVSGELEVVTFDVFLFSRDSQEDIDRKFAQYKEFLLNKDKSLRRPPLCRFTYGAAYNVKCIVRGFGDVEFDRLREDGKSRQIKFTMTLVKYKPYKIKEIDRNKPKKLSRHPYVSGSDLMWEMLAAKEYGTDGAIYGDRIRKYNKGVGFAAEEEKRIVLPKDDIILNEDIEPEFHGFDRRTDGSVDNLINKINSRRQKVLVV